MIQRTLPHTHRAKEIWQRSVSKTISYGLVILILDIVFIYWFSNQLKFAFGYMVIGNFYITVAYFFHERLWDGVTWGKFIYKKGEENPAVITERVKLSNYEEVI
jgi:uncharacterized membrane protein